MRWGDRGVCWGFLLSWLATSEGYLKFKVFYSWSAGSRKHWHCIWGKCELFPVFFSFDRTQFSIEGWLWTKGKFRKCKEFSHLFLAVVKCLRMRSPKQPFQTCIQNIITPECISWLFCYLGREYPPLGGISGLLLSSCCMFVELHLLSYLLAVLCQHTWDHLPLEWDCSTSTYQSGNRSSRCKWWRCFWERQNQSGESRERWSVEPCKLYTLVG